MVTESHVCNPPDPLVKSNVVLTAEAAVGGDLASWLTERRANGCSNRRIADLLAEKGVFVSGAAVRNWCASLGIEKGQPS